MEHIEISGKKEYHMRKQFLIELLGIALLVVGAVILRNSKVLGGIIVLAGAIGFLIGWVSWARENSGTVKCTNCGAKIYSALHKRTYLEDGYVVCPECDSIVFPDGVGGE